MPCDERFLDILGRRARDFMIMGVVGPVCGMLALVAIQVATKLHPDAGQHAAHTVAASLPPENTAPAARDANASSRVDAATLADIPAAVRVEAPAAPDALPQPATADFGHVKPTPSARHMADWVVGRHDNGKLPFVVLDKRAARLYVFQPDGRLVDDAPVLLGSSHGDDTFPGIGNVPISQVKPYQRTTAAGRFVTQPGLDADHTDVVWLDYDAALAMHRVINKVKAEHRLQRLASPVPSVRRISWGCINIPIAFFDRHISPVFGKHPGVAYVIPETKTFAQVFEQGGSPSPAVASAKNELRAPKDVADR